MQEMIINLFLISLAGTFTSCIALRNGAPQEACSTLLPRHGDNQPRQSNPPYTVSAESLGNNKIGVTISSTGQNFKGFILQARSASNRENFIPGEFETDSTSKGIDCEGQKQSTLTHVNNQPKAEVSTVWTGSVEEDIIFRATVVREFRAFWTNIDSDPVRIEEKPEEGNVLNGSEIYDCEESTGCFGMPADCVKDRNCKVLLKFKVNTKGEIQFSLNGMLDKSEYMAMGISEDSIMGDDFVTECLRLDSNEIKLRKSWNEGKNNTNTRDSESFHNSFQDGKTTCIWDEPKVLEFNGKTYDLTNKPHILLAYGDVKEERLKYHNLRLASSGPIDLFASRSVNNNEYGGNTIPITDKETDGEHSTEPTTKSEVTNEMQHSTSMSNYTDFKPTSSSHLNLSLFWIAFFTVCYTIGRNALNLI